MKSSVLILSFFAYAIGYIYLLLPYTNNPIHLIPFRSDIELSLESHVYYMCERVRMIVFFYIVWYCSEHYSKELRTFFFLSVGYFVDYVLFYNGTLFYIWMIPISYTLIMGVVMTFTVIKKMIYD